jgi:phosphoribosylformylglycinamidine synthase I
MKFGVIVFPGSNCDKDCEQAARVVTGEPVRMIWHKEESLGDVDAVIIPGGFSYGDYLRTGSIARFSPVMDSVIEFGRNGGMVIGICNGFQILLEAGLLPGALLRNAGLNFVCHDVYLRVENNATPFTNRYCENEVIRIPVAHGEGNYFIDPAGLAALEAHRQVVFRYVDECGCVTPEASPNGSIGNIAGICNREGNVLGLMPHPERLSEAVLGGTDGARVFLSMIEAWRKGGKFHA